MKKFLIIMVLINIIILVSCAPPRGRNSAKVNKTITTKNLESGSKISKKNIINIAEESKSDKVTTNIINYSDTTVIVLKPEETKVQSPLEKQFNQYADLFNNEKYDEACSKMQTFAETFDEGDSLKYEAVFFWCECLIYKNEIDKAEEFLSGLIENTFVKNNVREKALVRLGQVYCYKGENKQAQFYFDMLKKESPESIYLPLANCGVIK